MSWVAVGVAGATIVGGVVSSKKAEHAQQDAAKSSNALQWRMFQQNREDQSPWLKTGRQALGRLRRASQGNMGEFYRSPDYGFVRGEGQRNIGNSFAARGGAFGGNALRALTQYNQNLAKSEYGDWWNRQAGLAGVGQSAANTTGMFGANVAQNMGNNLIGAGDARASGIIGGTNAALSGLNSGLNAWAYFRRPTYGPMSNSLADNAGYTGGFNTGGYA